MNKKQYHRYLTKAVLRIEGEVDDDIVSVVNNLVFLLTKCEMGYFRKIILLDNDSDTEIAKISIPKFSSQAAVLAIESTLENVYMCTTCRAFEIIYGSFDRDEHCELCLYHSSIIHDDNCAICLEDLNIAPVFMTECNHSFHVGCEKQIKFIPRVKWESYEEEYGPFSCNHKVCPLCRAPYDSSDNQTGSNIQ